MICVAGPLGCCTDVRLLLCGAQIFPQILSSGECIRVFAEACAASASVQQPSQHSEAEEEHGSIPFTPSPSVLGSYTSISAVLLYVWTLLYVNSPEAPRCEWPAASHMSCWLSR